MKKSIMVFTALVGMVFSANALAYCSVLNAKIKEIFKDNNKVHIRFNKPTSCQCNWGNTLGYNQEDGTAFFTAAALDAYINGNTVDAMAYNNSSCELSEFHIHNIHK